MWTVFQHPEQGLHKCIVITDTGTTVGRQDASRIIADWILFYNTQRPHQALKMKTPAEAYALAA
ncbi:integrase core domain-containing protein [Advenella alkanexedens]|uniref:integrase core domain-containing protein n=1 Tax=Advenella alkanexedens TaxID=1481665 RepID=UPI001FE25968|nr:integrase core domain-containing protein [Advenella alkanexedens]